MPGSRLTSMKKILRLLLLGVAVPLAVSACAAAGLTPPPLSTTAPPHTLAPPTATVPAVAPTATPPILPVAQLVEATTAPSLSAPTEAVPTAAPPTATAYVPPRLVIPKLEVDQSIVPVLIADGTWDLDNLDKHVGWLTTTGAEPGDDLAMTLAGHVNISLGNPGPFLDLKRLKAGDQVIYRSGGLDYIYSVLTQTKVKPDAVDELYVADGNKLLLVTCSDWSYFWRHYSQRLIVTTALINTVASP